MKPVENPFDFYICTKCQRICTAVEMQKALGINPSVGSPCPCGGHKFSPTNLPWWGWFLPRVWTFAVDRVRGVV